MEINLNIKSACSHSWNINRDESYIYRAANMVSAVFLSLFGCYKVNVEDVKNFLTQHPECKDTYFSRNLIERNLKVRTILPITQCMNNEIPPAEETTEIPIAEEPALIPAEPSRTNKEVPEKPRFLGLKPCPLAEERSSVTEITDFLNNKIKELINEFERCINNQEEVTVSKDLVDAYKGASQCFVDSVYALAESRTRRLKGILFEGTKKVGNIDRDETTEETVARLIICQSRDEYQGIKSPRLYKMPEVFGKYETIFNKMSVEGRNKFLQQGTLENELREQYNLFSKTLVDLMEIGFKIDAVQGRNEKGSVEFADRSYDERFEKHFKKPHNDKEWKPSGATWPT